MSETEPKKRGFFSKLFGLEDEQAKPETTVTVPGPEAPPAPEPEAPLASEDQTGEAAPLPLAPPEPEPEPEPEPVAPAAVAPQPKRSWWRRLTEGLSRTSTALTTGITDLFTKRKLDAGTLEDLEDILIQAATTSRSSRPR
jgi:fused signal recognition particle receptor